MKWFPLFAFIFLSCDHSDPNKGAVITLATVADSTIIKNQELEKVFI